jgi:hypothetical protein
LRGPRRVGGAEIDGFEDGAHRALGRDGIFAHEFSAAAQHTAEILRPRTIDCAVDDDLSDVPCPQLLRLGWTAQKGIGLSVCEELHRLDRRGDNPVYILVWVEPDLRGHHSQEQMGRRSKGWDSDLFAFEVGDTPNTSVAKQLEAANMRASQHRDREAAVDGLDVFRRILQTPNPALHRRALPECFGLVWASSGYP